MEVCYVCQDPVDDGDQLWVVALEGSLRSQVLDDIIQQRVYLSLLMNEEDDQERNGEQWQLIYCFAIGVFKFESRICTVRVYVS